MYLTNKEFCLMRKLFQFLLKDILLPNIRKKRRKEE